MQTLSKNKLKWLRSLHLQKNRNNEGKFLLFGEKIIDELLQNNPELVDVVCSSNEDLCSAKNYFYIDDSELKSLSGFKSSPKLLAAVSFPETKAKNEGLTLILDGIQDPGNMGTIIRSADWFGVKEIVCSTDSVDMFNPKVVQSSMGSILRVAITYIDLTTYLKDSALDIYGAMLDGENVFDLNIKSNSALLIGNEGQGIREDLEPYITTRVTIPAKGQAESLNAAIATGILLALFSFN